MPIVMQDPGIGGGLQQALTGLSTGIAAGLEKRAKTRLEDKSWGNLLDGLEEHGGELGALAKVMKDSETTPSMGMPFLKQQMEATTKGSSASAQQRDTYKTNQQLIAGVSSDARKAKSLLAESDNLRKAIESKLIPGRGVAGSITEGVYDFFNLAPKEVQLMKSIAKRSIIDMGDTKGIRLTDTKLKFLEDNLWNPRKSRDENMQAYELWRDTMESYVGYERGLGEMIEGDKNAMFDPTLSIRISEGKYKRPESDNTEQKTVDKKSFDKPTNANAKENKGLIFRNPDTGERIMSNGNRWVKYKG